MRRAVKFLLEHAAAGLLLDPGMSKTAITLAAFKILHRKGIARRMLVVAPLRVCHLVWPKEVAKWKDFGHLRVEVLHGKDKEEALLRDADVYVINPEGLEWLLGVTKTRTPKGKIRVEVNLKRLRSFCFDTLALDELTRFKSISGVRTKAMKLCLGTFRRRWGLTGSLTANGLMDLFGQMYMLDQGNALGQFITKFRSDYFVPTGPFDWKPQKGAADRIAKAIAPLCFRASAKDYLEMPEVIDLEMKVTLPPDVRRLYDQLEDDLVARWGGKTLLAVSAAAASTKCRQVASGAVYMDPELASLTKSPPRGAKREWMRLHDAKLDALEELVEELQGKPLLVGYDFRHDLERIRERFGDVPALGGGVSTETASRIESMWNRGEIPMLPCHPLSVGHGLNMQGGDAAHMCWFSSTWDAEMDAQLFGRIWRQGNKARRVFRHRIIAEDTVDEVQFWALRGKAKGHDAFGEELERLRSRRRKKK